MTINETVLFENRISKNGRLLLTAGLNNSTADLQPASARETVLGQINAKKKKKMKVYQNWATNLPFERWNIFQPECVVVESSI